MSEFTKNISIKNLFFNKSCFNAATRLSWLESILFSLLIGLYFKNVFLGFATCFILIILEGIPLISVVYPFLFSFMESVLIFKITINYLPMNQGSLIALISFFILVEIHKTTGKINCTALGYGLILFEEILIAGLLYSLNHKIELSSILILTGIFFLTCISFCRMVAIVLLTISTSLLIFQYAKTFLNNQNTILFLILTLSYSITVYLWAYLGNDYIGFYRQKKFEKILKEKENEFPDIKSRVYEKYPVLAGQYQYYQTSVCTNSEERREFDIDWKHYLIYLDSASRNITFNRFFEKQKLYQIRKYKQNPYRVNPYHTAKRSNRNSNPDFQAGIKNDTSYFAGVTDRKSLKKRYRDLQKIYHPDNQNGDSAVSKQIKEEYEALSNKFK